LGVGAAVAAPAPEAAEDFDDAAGAFAAPLPAAGVGVAAGAVPSAAGTAAGAPVGTLVAPLTAPGAGAGAVAPGEVP
jgi:hypothetical protein